MALRMKTRFRRSGPKTLEDRAGVVAFNIWKIAQEMFRRMGKEGFTFTSEDQVTEFLTEVLAFLVQVADRLVYGRLSEAERSVFVNAVGRQLARTMQDNRQELKGEGNHAAAFIETLNARFADYAAFEFTDRGPGYAFVRYLGERLAENMAAGDNKWVKEYVMEIEVPEAVKHLKRLVGEVLGIRAA